MITYDQMSDGCRWKRLCAELPVTSSSHSRHLMIANYKASNPVPMRASFVSMKEEVLDGKSKS